MAYDWKTAPLEALGDYVGQMISVICEDGEYTGGLKGFTETSILLEIGEGEILAVRRDILQDSLTELYVLEELV